MAETRQNGGALETVDGTVRSVVFRNDETGFTVLHVALADDGRFRLAEQVVTVLGACAAAWEGEELHATGEWVNDPARGRQFKAKTMECIPPKSAEGIRRYLASGLIRGIGPVLANRIVDRFGVDTIDVLDHHSGRLQEIPKVGPKKIEAVVKGWREGQMDKSGEEINKAAIRPDGTLADDAFEVDYVRVFDPEGGW